MIINTTILAVLALIPGAGQTNDAELAFNRFKAMVGDWEGASKEGVKIRHKYTLVGNGSVVMEESWFDAHKGDIMVTMYSMHEGKLILTHYCVAKNQPRLVASSIKEKGGKVEFTFMDATGIASREQGHMDRARYEFIGADRYKTAWTWYAKGKEQWMEEFDLRRMKSGEKPRSLDTFAPSCHPDKPGQ